MKSKREARLLEESKAFLVRFGYQDPMADMVQEVFTFLSHAYTAGFNDGRSEGHAEGWEDHARQKGCDCG